MLEIGDILVKIGALIKTYNNDSIDVSLENISTIDISGSVGSEDDKIIMSVVNVEEEKTQRYSETFSRTSIPVNGQQEQAIIQHNPTVFLNLYVLFSCHQKNYQKSLNNISKVIHFFQRWNIFISKESAFLTNANNVEVVADFPEGMEKLIFELYSLSFEQMNHLWGILGGKYIPAVLYKVRFIPHKNIEGLKAGGRILREKGAINQVQ